ncbi:MAG: hypothetical protein NTW86_23055 [Candidatus Sumerlaeota bacterium]|nr:hypothetical protein [Candidatus Sumerlaeota bacterium]
MAIPTHPQPCAPCPLPRRTFLAACSACAAGVAPWAGRPAAAAERKKLSIRVAFLHPASSAITWPNIGYDYDARGEQLLASLAPMCPDVEPRPTHVVTAADIKRVMAADGEVAGYLIYMLGSSKGARALVDELGKAGRPMVMVEDQYAGPYSLGFNAHAEKAKWNAIGLSTSRLEDVAGVVRCFRALREPGATAADFLAAARKEFAKNIVRGKGDLNCADDPVRAGDVAECLERLRSSSILLVGRDPGPPGKSIAEIFGVPTVVIQFAELHQAFLDAQPAQAAEWADRWTQGADKVVEPTRDDIVKSGAMHLAMAALMKKHNAQAISINCLRGFYSGQLQAYPCLGFVELNNSGRVGACEGDLASTVAMLAMGYLVGRPGFISDPVIDTATNRVTYAHCVAPTKVFGPHGPDNPYHLRSHSEDRRGAAVRSLLPLGYMTTSLRFNPVQRLCVMHQGKAVENVDEDKACRTKLAVELQGDIGKLLHDWSSGWHRVTYYGDLKEHARALCEATGIKLAQEA